MGVFLIKHNNAGRNAGAVKEVGRQADNPLDISLAYNILAYLRFSSTPEQNPVGEDAGALAAFSERTIWSR
jgi:hypothetical protein